MKEFNFSLELVEIPVKLNGADYVLREADEETAAMFNNARLAGIRLEDGKMAGLPSDIASLQSLLVSRCLFTVSPDGSKSRVDRGIVKGWPSRVVKPLFERAKEISDLDETPTLAQLREQRDAIDKQIKDLETVGDPAKNELSDTLPG